MNDERKTVVQAGKEPMMGSDLLNTIEMEDGTEVKVTDILFGCPHCGKNLAIDYRGAGLITNCTECGEQVEVPIPEGMDLSDLDLGPDDQELRILNLRRSLSTAESRIAELEEQVATLERRRAALEKTRAEAWSRFEEISKAAEIVRRSQLEVSSAIGKITDVAKTRLS